MSNLFILLDRIQLTRTEVKVSIFILFYLLSAPPCILPLRIRQRRIRSVLRPSVHHVYPEKHAVSFDPAVPVRTVSLFVNHGFSPFQVVLPVIFTIIETFRGKKRFPQMCREQCGPILNYPINIILFCPKRKVNTLPADIDGKQTKNTYKQGGQWPPLQGL